MSLEQFYTAEQVAEKLQLHPKTVLRLAREGRLRSVLINRARRFPESAVTELLSGDEEDGSVAQVVQIDGRR